MAEARMRGFLFWRLAAQIIALNLDRYATAISGSPVRADGGVVLGIT
jgi:hypothetical protein